MTRTSQPPSFGRRAVAIWATVGLGLLAMGYVLGIVGGSVPPWSLWRQAATGGHGGTDAEPPPMHPERPPPGREEPTSGTPVPLPPDVVASLRYSEMRRADEGPTSQWHSGLPELRGADSYDQCILCHEPHTLAVRARAEDKQTSLAVRATRRAFNGAPPVIPHPVEQTNDAACFGCHGKGARIGKRIANRMSHRHLTHCVQCHAPPPPADVFGQLPAVENDFVGLPTPSGGPRAFPHAPPLIPHSTWMRENCLTCHGGLAGWPGLQVTHRWRANCLQCHGTDATREQGIIALGATRPTAERGRAGERGP